MLEINQLSMTLSKGHQSSSIVLEYLDFENEEFVSYISPVDANRADEMRRVPGQVPGARAVIRRDPGLD